MKVIFSIFAMVMSFNAFAFDCPNTTLNCQVVDAMNSKVLASQSVKYSAINRDEPSEEANECVAQIFFSSTLTGAQSDLVATLQSGDLFLHAQTFGKAKDPQFMVSPSLNQIVTLFDGLRRLECTLK